MSCFLLFSSRSPGGGRLCIDDDDDDCASSLCTLLVVRRTFRMLTLSRHVADIRVCRVVITYTFCGSWSLWNCFPLSVVPPPVAYVCLLAALSLGIRRWIFIGSL